MRDLLLISSQTIVAILRCGTSGLAQDQRAIELESSSHISNMGCSLPIWLRGRNRYRAYSTAGLAYYHRLGMTGRCAPPSARGQASDAKASSLATGVA